jgi:hypothetical protein
MTVLQPSTQRRRSFIAADIQIELSCNVKQREPEPAMIFGPDPNKEVPE